MDRTFVYLPSSRRYINLANVVEVRDNHGSLRVRTTAPDGRRPYDGDAFSPDHYVIDVPADSVDGLALTDALAESLVKPNHDQVPR